MYMFITGVGILFPCSHVTIRVTMWRATRSCCPKIAFSWHVTTRSLDYTTQVRGHSVVHSKLFSRALVIVHESPADCGVPFSG